MERELTLSEEVARIVAERYVKCNRNKVRTARSLGISLRTLRSYVNGGMPGKVVLHSLDTRGAEFLRELERFLENPPR